MKVMVVDDSQLSLRRLAKVCEALGHEVLSANSVDKAKEVLEREPGIEAILTDLHMPGAEGIELINAMSNGDGSIPVVVVTADVQKSTMKECLNQGARFVLNKPVDPAELDFALKNLSEQPA